jgi:hypothetical protein
VGTCTSWSTPTASPGRCWRSPSGWASPGPERRPRWSLPVVASSCSSPTDKKNKSGRSPTWRTDPNLIAWPRSGTGAVEAPSELRTRWATSRPHPGKERSDRSGQHRPLRIGISPVHLAAPG